MALSRSRKGAWIEIAIPTEFQIAIIGRSRKGAWIEITAEPYSAVAIVSLP